MWKKFSSAPKDGQRFLVCKEGNKDSITILYWGKDWSQRGGPGWTNGSWFCDDNYFTHWQDLPDVE